ncbi:MAG: hypothetical protein GY798_10605 [Hyphomicrobiales bacterium]|nr:hypothetical protein [Hyphomicrobiales bacterium]
MVRVHALIGIVLGSLVLAGCEHQSGAGAGSSTVGSAVAVGAGTGSEQGNATGPELDQSAQRRARDAELRALEHGRTGTPVTWRNGKVRGEVVPGPRYQVNAYNCRDYTHTVYGQGQSQSVRGTACRQPNGSWQPVT